MSSTSSQKKHIFFVIFSSTTSPTHNYSPEHEDAGEVSIGINAISLITTRLQTHTSFDSHKSLSKSIQSLRSNQQPAVALPVKKCLHGLLKQEQITASLKSNETKKDYQYHHYHNSTELCTKSDKTSPEEEEEEFDQQQQQQQINEKDPAVRLRFDLN
ncbi:unnamed protein product [Rotaria sordida]|uniref:Uncharacterized protein n=1 Tax=Rotaria sordida TaxID=392033 RepID=A0A818ZP74_9BILA|nr:unnamed protein product [Rotaria sordida]CAF1212333.1 unnamed protein product [Rotaria sordida]CAF3689278.1 unnamed protein product [Rotaria sordida]CAF3766275.1 unnamed protein product [Rotaria sordida]